MLHRANEDTYHAGSADHKARVLPWHRVTQIPVNRFGKTQRATKPDNQRTRPPHENDGQQEHTGKDQDEPQVGRREVRGELYASLVEDDQEACQCRECEGSHRSHRVAYGKAPALFQDNPCRAVVGYPCDYRDDRKDDDTEPEDQVWLIP